MSNFLEDTASGMAPRVDEHLWDCRLAGANGYTLWYKGPTDASYTQIGAYYSSIESVKTFVKRAGHIRAKMKADLADCEERGALLSPGDPWATDGFMGVEEFSPFKTRQ